MEKELKKIKDGWDVLQYKAEHFLCDKDGEKLVGTESVEALKKRMTKGQLNDIVYEAEQIITSGKLIASRIVAVD